MEKLIEQMKSMRNEMYELSIESDEHQLVIATASGKIAAINLRKSKLMRDMDKLNTQLEAEHAKQFPATTEPK
jgi:hypothetical protein